MSRSKKNIIEEGELTSTLSSHINLGELCLRKMQVRDLDQVYDLEKRCFPDGWTRQHFIHEVLENAFSIAYVVENTGELIAYSVYWHLESEAHLMTFAVEENQRRKGVASYLLSRLIEEWRNLKVGKVHLEVRHSNHAALNLYRKFGFKKSGLRKSYYANKDDAISMTLSLTEGVSNGLV